MEEIAEFIKLHFSLLDIDAKWHPSPYIMDVITVTIPFTHINVYKNGVVEFGGELTIGTVSSLASPNFNADIFCTQLRTEYRKYLTHQLGWYKGPDCDVDFKRKMKIIARMQNILTSLNRGM